MRTLSLMALLLTWGCSKAEPAPSPAPSASAAAPEGPHYGEVMSEIGHRFELSGRAAVAGRFRLAGYEIDELGEAIDEDLSRAEPPREGDPKKLASLLNELKSQRMPALTRAAKAKDASAYRGAFANAAKTCNACHEATEHPFVEVPEVPGGSVPRLDPRDAGL